MSWLDAPPAVNVESIAQQVAELLASLDGPQRPSGYDPALDVDTPEPDYASPAECDAAADREFSQRMGWGR